MKKYETITSIISLICLITFGSGTGIILLYNNGNLLSHIVIFITLFGTSFFISGIQDHRNIDTFISDISIGVAAILLSGLVLLLGTYETLSLVAPLLIYAIVIFKLTGKSNDEKIRDEVCVLIANASERLIQADGIQKYRDKMLKRAEWLDEKELDKIADALIKYSISLTSYSKFLLSQSYPIKNNPFKSMAMQPKEEEIIVSSLFPDDSRSIIMRVREWDDGGSGAPCPADVLKWIVLEV